MTKEQLKTLADGLSYLSGSDFVLTDEGEIRETRRTDFYRTGLEITDAVALLQIMVDQEELRLKVSQSRLRKFQNLLAELKGDE